MAKRADRRGGADGSWRGLRAGASSAGRILVVEDDPATAETVELYLRDAGYEVDTAADGRAGLERAGSGEHDLVILDLMLPGLEGVEICRRLRRVSRLPLIMVTARTTEEDRVLGLQLGADDYVTKPFSPRELVARVQAVLRRAAAGAPAGEVLRFGDLCIDLPRQRVEVDGRSSDLTGTETPPATGPGGHAGAGVRPRGAHRAGPGPRLPGLRPDGRRSHQEPAQEGRAGPIRPRVHPDGRGLRLPLRRRAGAAAVRVGLRARRVEAGFLQPLRRWLLGGVAVTLVLALAATALLSRSILRPLAELRQAVGGMQSGDLSRRARVQSTDEIGDLADSFNVLADSLERNERSRRDPVADVAHELRTPLTGHPGPARGGAGRSPGARCRPRRIPPSGGPVAGSAGG